MRVAVAGAGIVGVSCALHLRRAGHDVTLIDPREPGTATSFGNAGGIVTGAVVPNSTPALRRRLWRMLGNQDSAVRLRWADLPSLTPWLRRFLHEGRPDNVRRIAAALQPLVSRAYDAHRELVLLCEAQDLVRPVGWLKVYADDAGLAATRFDRALMAAHNVRVAVLNADEIRQLEPALAFRFQHALFQPDSAFVTSPLRLTRAYLGHFIRIGGRVVQDRVRGIVPEPAGVALDCEFAFRQTDAVVIAAGIWSQQLAAQTGDRVLLAAERGYHLNLDPGRAGELRRPVVFPDQGGFVLAPMQDGIRLTSGVELARPDAPPDFSRIRRLVPRALDVLPGLSERITRQWIGARPSTPDSLPVIGRSPRTPHVFYAFGHQHLGLTLGPVTGRLIAALVSGRAPEFDVSPYSIARF
jgi:D-amino-acid dehydrogenase